MEGVTKQNMGRRSCTKWNIWKTMNGCIIYTQTPECFALSMKESREQRNRWSLCWGDTHVNLMQGTVFEYLLKENVS